jgi:hypothetical protein
LAFSLLGDYAGGHMPSKASNSTIIHPRPVEVGFGEFSFQYVSLPHIQVLKSTPRKTHMTVEYEADSLKWRLIAQCGHFDKPTRRQLSAKILSFTLPMGTYITRYSFVATIRSTKGLPKKFYQCEGNTGSEHSSCPSYDCALYCSVYHTVGTGQQFSEEGDKRMEYHQTDGGKNSPGTP